jgi:hypothetical protein
LSYPSNPLLLAQLFHGDISSDRAIEHQNGSALCPMPYALCPLPNSDDFGADLYGKVSRKETFLTVPGVCFVLHFSALLFFTAQSSARCYHPSASPVLYPEDREDPSNPPLQSSNEFQFFVLPRFFSPVLLLKNGMERPANQREPFSVLAVF